MAAIETRGIRNHNPGNIRRSGDPWQGLAAQQSDPAFFRFESAVWGIRALARTLTTYYDRHGCDCVRAIIGRWAPPSENNTSAYVGHVARSMGVAVSASLDLHRYEHMRPLVEAIIAHENRGYRYSGAVVDEGLKLAGIVPPASGSTIAAVARDPKVIATGIATAAASAQATVSSVSAIWDDLARTVEPRILVWAAVAAVAALGIWFAWQAIQARREGRT